MFTAMGTRPLVQNCTICSIEKEKNIECSLLRPSPNTTLNIQNRRDFFQAEQYYVLGLLVLCGPLLSLMTLALLFWPAV